MRILTSEHLVDEDARAVYRRSFIRRLLTSGRMQDRETVMTPSQNAMQLPDGTLIVHPAVLHTLQLTAGATFSEASLDRREGINDGQ